MQILNFVTVQKSVAFPFSWGSSKVCVLSQGGFTVLVLVLLSQGCRCSLEHIWPKLRTSLLNLVSRPPDVLSAFLVMYLSEVKFYLYPHFVRVRQVMHKQFCVLLLVPSQQVPLSGTAPGADAAGGRTSTCFWSWEWHPKSMPGCRRVCDSLWVKAFLKMSQGSLNALEFWAMTDAEVVRKWHLHSPVLHLPTEKGSISAARSCCSVPELDQDTLCGCPELLFQEKTLLHVNSVCQADLLPAFH